MRLALGTGLAGLIAFMLWFWLSGTYTDVTQWAVTQQRIFQNDLAAGIMAARRGAPGVVWSVILASALYGFVHALGPGHGKFLIGSAGLGSRAEARTMAGIAMLSAIAQGGTAVLLVYGGLGLLSVGTRWAENVTNDILTPASYGVIALIGVVLLYRGARGAMRVRGKAVAGPEDHEQHDPHHHDHHAHAHDDDCGCGHRHGPTPEEISRLTGWRDALMLVAGIAIRPCTGAVIVLVIAWQTGLHLLGLAAVFAMALGTGAFTSLVALASVSAREASFSFSGATAARLSLVAPALQVFAGVAVLALSLGMLRASLA